MKIALLSDCYLPRLGGIEVQVHDLAERLSARGHDVEVFTATAGAGCERGGTVESVDGIAVHRLAIALPWGLPVNPLAPPMLRERLRGGGFDVAHIHMGVVSPFAVDCARVTSRLGLPTAMTWHCMLHWTAGVVSLLGVVRRWAEHGMAMSAVSAVAAEPLRGIVGAGARVSLLPNGIDVSAWAPEPGATEPGATEPRTTEPALPVAGGGRRPVRIVTAMRLARRKRPVPLLRMAQWMRALLPASVGVSLEILGDGPDRALIERHLEREAMASWVTLAGRVPRADLRQRYAASDIYVSPSVLESFGIAALEARTVGLPVVARSGSGIAEFVTHGVNGLLAPDDETMARQLADLVRDTERRTRIRRHNETTPPEQDWGHVVRLAEAEYARARGGR
ncbi:MAG TPA: glycosyltransferase [Candidatus Lustribacter sp.]|nr:glycosyltransferase [Candidatus Lustribacter sp.]